MAVYLVIWAAVLAYGVWYGVNPMRVLSKKYMGDEVPPVAVKTARIMGVVLAVIGIAGIVVTIVKAVAAA